MVTVPHFMVLSSYVGIKKKMYWNGSIVQASLNQMFELRVSFSQGVISFVL